MSNKTSLKTFMIKCLEGLDAGKKVDMLDRVQYKSFLPILECFNFDNTYYPVFPYMTIPLSQVIHSPPYPTELELTVVLEQVHSHSVLAESLLIGLDSQGPSVSRVTQA